VSRYIENLHYTVVKGQEIHGKLKVISLLPAVGCVPVRCVRCVCVCVHVCDDQYLCLPVPARMCFGSLR